MLPSLVGTLVGGGVTLLVTHMTIKHQNELEDKKRKAALDDDRRRYERGNLTRLQEAMQHSARITAKRCTQLLKLARAGKSGSGWIVNHDDSEAQRQSLEDILLLTARLAGNELDDAIRLSARKLAA